MAVPKPRRELVEDDDALSDDALALIEHIGAILAEEYVSLMKSANAESNTEEVEE